LGLCNFVFVCMWCKSWFRGQV